MRLIKKYNWPGNIRELDNVIERAIILTEDEIIGVEDLHIFEAPREPHWKSLKELEKDYIEEVLPDFDSFSLFLTPLISETLDKSTFCFSISHFFIIL